MKEVHSQIARLHEVVDQQCEFNIHRNASILQDLLSACDELSNRLHTTERQLQTRVEDWRSAASEDAAVARMRQKLSHRKETLRELETLFCRWCLQARTNKVNSLEDELSAKNSLLCEDWKQLRSELQDRDAQIAELKKTVDCSRAAALTSQVRMNSLEATVEACNMQISHLEEEGATMRGTASQEKVRQRLAVVNAIAASVGSTERVLTREDLSRIIRLWHWSVQKVRLEVHREGCKNLTSACLQAKPTNQSQEDVFYDPEEQEGDLERLSTGGTSASSMLG